VRTRASWIIRSRSTVGRNDRYIAELYFTTPTAASSWRIGRSIRVLGGIEFPRMMAKDDWFRRSTWTTQGQADFTTRLRRSRTAYHKSQYLRIQAKHLQDVGTEPMLHSAVELLDQLVSSFPDPSQLSLALLQRAQCLVDLGKFEDAIASFRRSFEACRAAPRLRNLAYLDLQKDEATFACPRVRAKGLGRSVRYPVAIPISPQARPRALCGPGNDAPAAQPCRLKRS
jgi:tetratricopeptide (TPR) repeat protein